MLLALWLTLAAGQQGAVPLDRGWELSGAGSRIETHSGRQAIRLVTGRAIRRDVSLGDGTIEFDMEVTPNRTFAYLQFRMESDRDFEEIYFRPHKSGLPDGIQYNPVWRGDSFWQLWHGPDASGLPRFRHRQWIHVRLVLEGRRAAVFLDRSPTPVMVANLAREPRAGYFALRGFNADSDFPDETSAWYANVVVRPGVVDHDFGPPPSPPTFPPGTITAWQISPAFPADTFAVTSLPDSLLAGRDRWPVYPVERTGVVAIGRHQDRPRPDGGAVARLRIRADRAGRQRLYLGYSDYVTVFVNGIPVFSGDAHYSFNQPRQEGLIGLWQATLWLPLEAGDNEVLLAIVDGFGGWGLAGRLDPADGGRLVGQR